MGEAFETELKMLFASCQVFVFTTRESLRICEAICVHICFRVASISTALHFTQKPAIEHENIVKYFLYESMQGLNSISFAYKTSSLHRKLVCSCKVVG